MELDRIFKQQKNFFDSGQTRPLNFRLEQLKQLEKFLQDNETALLAAMKKDLGKSFAESYLSELGLLYRSLRKTRKELPFWLKKTRKKTPFFLWPANSYTLRMPLGNSLIISPFNYPLLLSFDPLIGSMAGGNTAIISLSPETPHLNQLLTELQTLYFPTSYLHFVIGGKERNTFLLSQPFNKFFFTGSAQVGKVVMQAASQHLASVTLELGGKSPALITKSANLKQAAQRIAWGKFLNVGQTCVAPDYVLIHSSQKELFLRLLQESITDYYGHTIMNNADYPKIINRQAFDRLEKIIKLDSAYLKEGGETNRTKLFIAPTLLLASTKDQLVAMEEEIFGPILPILTYDSLEEALTLIKKQKPALAFYPFSTKQKELDFLLEEITSGGVTVNDVVLHLANEALPFGGVGSSGLGNYHGKYSFDAFTQERAVLQRYHIFNHNLLFPPYKKNKQKIIRKLLK